MPPKHDGLSLSFGVRHLMELKRIEYKALSAPQKEVYNYQKVAAVLADYGYCTIRLSDDWCGADFIAQHIDGSFLKVQLKARLALNKKYVGSDLWLCFPDAGAWYLGLHDDILNHVIGIKRTLQYTDSWASEGHYNCPKLDQQLIQVLAKYRIP